MFYHTSTERMEQHLCMVHSLMNGSHKIVLPAKFLLKENFTMLLTMVEINYINELNNRKSESNLYMTSKNYWFTEDPT